MIPRLRGALDFGVLAGALATIPLTVLREEGAKSRALEAMDWAVWSIFAIEFLFIVFVTPKFKILRASTVGDLAVVALSFPLLPNLLALVRVARLIRVARLLRLARLTGTTARGLGALKGILGRRGLIYTVALTSLVILVGGGCLSILEPETVKGGYGDGIWWAVVTATTVGYGDISPSTLPGRIIAVVLMVVGIGLMSTLAASITTHFVQQKPRLNLAPLKKAHQRPFPDDYSPAAAT